MNNLYHKVAVVSVCTTLGFTLGANKEAKAVTFTLTPTSSYSVGDVNLDGVGDWRYEDFVNLPVGIQGPEEMRAFYEFNPLLSLSAKNNLEGL